MPESFVVWVEGALHSMSWQIRTSLQDQELAAGSVYIALNAAVCAIKCKIRTGIMLDRFPVGMLPHVNDADYQGLRRLVGWQISCRPGIWSMITTLEGIDTLIGVDPNSPASPNLDWRDPAWSRRGIPQGLRDSM